MKTYYWSVEGHGQRLASGTIRARSPFEARALLLQQFLPDNLRNKLDELHVWLMIKDKLNTLERRSWDLLNLVNPKRGRQARRLINRVSGLP